MSESREEPHVSYDPYDVGINADPYPVFRRLREEAPLYYNEPYDFYAVSRFADVQAGLSDHETYISGRGVIIEMIKAKFQPPPGVFIFEDPPVHTVHRGVLKRVFTPRKMDALEPKIREFCARCLDPLVGGDRFDFVSDLGAELPMRTIGMLAGIPDSEQPAVREHANQVLRNEAAAAKDNPLSRVVSSESEKMSQLVTTYLDRARIAARSAVVGKKADATMVMLRLVRVMEKLNKHVTIAFKRPPVVR